MPESLAWTVKLEVPAVVGVPLIVPPPLKANPAGKLPEETLHVMVPAPPLDARVVLYAVLTKPLGREVEVMTSLELMVMVNACLAV